MDDNTVIQTSWGPMTLGQLRALLSGRSEATAKYDQVRLDEEIRQFNEKMGETREDRRQRLKLESQALSLRREELKVTRGRAEADKWYQEQQIEIRNRELGFSILRTAVEARKSPSSWADVVNLGVGVRQNAGLVAPLRALVGGGQMPSFVAQAGLPNATTVQSLTDDLLNGSADERALTGSQNDLSWIAMNPNKLAPGSVESLGQTGQEVLFGGLQSGITQNGVAKTVDIPTWLRGYMFAKPGQGISDQGLA